MERLEDRTVPTGSVSGVVYNDVNVNGVRDAGEPGVAGVLVEMLGNDWSPVADGITGSDGSYVVSGVPEDSYNARFSVPSLSNYQFWYFGSGATSTYYPMGVGATVDMALYAPPVVSVVSLGEASEGGEPSAFRFARTGDLSSGLTIDYSFVTGEPGSAVPGDDFVPVPGSVTIPAGWEYYDVPIAAWADNDYDPDEEVKISIEPSPNYTRLGTGRADMPVLDTSFIVTTTADVVSIPDNKVSLREAIMVANGIWRVNYRVISFNFPGTTGTITLTSTLPPIEKAISIAGPGDRGVTITGAVQHMKVNKGADLRLAGLRFVGAVTGDDGGAINSRGVLSVSNCEFRECEAQSGGAIAATESDTGEPARPCGHEVGGSGKRRSSFTPR